MAIIATENNGTINGLTFFKVSLDGIHVGTAVYNPEFKTSPLFKAYSVYDVNDKKIFSADDLIDVASEFFRFKEVK